MGRTLIRHINNLMMKAILLLTFVLFAGSYCKAQTIISGKVSDKSGTDLTRSQCFYQSII